MLSRFFHWVLCSLFSVASVPRLIINADDFGLTSGVNRAIEEGSRAGAITSATLMANSRAFAEAVNMAKNIPALKTGCHIVLVDGEPLSQHVPSLTDGGVKFKSSLKDFALAAIRKRLSQDEIRQEAEAQIRKIQSAGITVTHVDTHKHTHIFPHVLHSVLKAARACGVPAIRNPFEPFKTLPIGAVLRPSLWTRALEVALLRRFSTTFQRSVRDQHMSTTDGMAGVIATGSLDRKLLLAIVHRLPEGTWELVCHPGYLDSDLRNAGTRLLESRRVELEALLSEEVRQAVARRGIRLMSYEEIALGH